MLTSFVRHLITLVATLTPAVIAIAASSPVNPPAPVPCGVCYALGAEDGQRIIVPLELTEVVLDVKPGLIEAEVTQTFTNRTNTALEATYLYPLPGGATLTEVELRYRDRLVRSEVREKVQARADYEKAKAEGKKAALLEQHDPSLFSTAVANFLPGETVHVVIRYVQPLDLRSDAIDVRFPMVTGEKYFPSEATPGVIGNAAANPARRAADAIAPNHVYAFDIQVAGIPVQTIASPSHRVNVFRDEGAAERYRVALAEEITIPDRDFVLRIDLRPGEALQPTVVTQHTATGDYGLLTVFPPRNSPKATGPRIPRDVLFLLDRSGSMQGVRLDNAKLGLERCLGMLAAEDRFHVVVFAQQHHFYRPEWTTATALEVEQARHYVHALQVDGGTELQPALAAALDTFAPAGRQQILVLLTDGDVGNEGSLFNLIENKIGQVRLFTFGIGGVPNATLLQKMAELGRGQARFINDDRMVDRELTDFFTTLDTPVISNVRVSLVDSSGQPMAYQMFPEQLPDVFVGRPIQTVFRTNAGAPQQVVVEGVEGGSPVVHRLTLQPAALRGDGLEKQFGRRLYADTKMMLGRARTESERALVQQELLATALQFQLVTELTSRVALAQEVSRDPGAPLASRHVAQYSAVDRAGPAIRGSASGDIVELMPFEVNTETEGTYLVSGFRTEPRRMLGAAEIITRNFLDDFAPRSTEDSLAFTMQGQYGLISGQGGQDFGLLDGLPIATVIDPATVNEITLQTVAPVWAEINQSRIPRVASTTLTARAGDEGFSTATFKMSTAGELPVLAIASWTKFERVQWGGFLEGKKEFGETRARASLQARELDGYGRMRLGRVALEHKLNDVVMVEGVIAWHALKRDDPHQFRVGSPTAQYDRLGFFNLDLLTAETRSLEDTIVQAQISGKVFRGPNTHTWSARARWHRQDSDWAVPQPDATLGHRRETSTIDANYRASFLDDHLALTTRLNGSTIHARETTDEHERTRAANVGLTAVLSREVGVFGNWSREETLPWIMTGRWLANGVDLRAVSPPIEVRQGTQLGLNLGTWSHRLSGAIAVFHENVSDLSARDWSWERAHAGGLTLLESGGELRALRSTRVWPAFAREGWMGWLSLNPSRSFAGRIAWSRDWKNDGPYRGGNERASLAGRYDFRFGPLVGIVVGAGLTYRNTLVFDDGYALHGGVRSDVMCGYRLRHGAGRETLLQVNLANLTGRSWQETRFSPDHGRQLTLSVMRGF